MIVGNNDAFCAADLDVLTALLLLLLNNLAPSNKLENDLLKEKDALPVEPDDGLRP